MNFRRRRNDEFSDSPFWEAVGAPSRFIKKVSSRFFKSDDSLQSNRSIGAKIVGVLAFPFRFSWGIVVFMVQAWTSSRPGFAFVRAIPAMLFVALYFMGLLVADFVNSERRVLATNKGYYSYYLSESFDEPKYATWFAQKLIEVKPEIAEHKYLLGIAYERNDELVKAFDVISSIAPEDQPGLAPAHLWLSSYYSKAEMSEEESESQVLKHIGLALAVDPENQQAHQRMALYYLRESGRQEEGSEDSFRNLELAKEHLEEVTSGDVSILLINAMPMLLDVKLKLGLEEATDSVRSDISRMMPIANENPEIFEIWLAMIKCAVLAEDYPKAIEVVRAGVQSAKSREVKFKIAQLGSQVFLKSADKYTDMNNIQQFQKRFNQLCAAVEFNPNERASSSKLLEFIELEPTPPVETGSSDDAPPATLLINELWLHESVTSNSPNSADGVTHALIGIHRIAEGKIAEGESHWRIAMADKKFSNISSVINNLIESASLNRVDDFSNLLDMMTLAIELFPDQTALYLTRGKYLKRQRRYEEAISDLSYVLEKSPILEVHKHLIICFEAIGDEEKAREQTAQLEEKLDALDDATRLLVDRSLQRIENRD